MPSVMGTTMFSGTDDPEHYERSRSTLPLRTVVHATDVADAVVWLLSDLSRTVTAQETVIDAGLTRGA